MPRLGCGRDLLVRRFYVRSSAHYSAARVVELLNHRRRYAPSSWSATRNSRRWRIAYLARWRVTRRAANVRAYADIVRERTAAPLIEWATMSRQRLQY